MKQKFKLTGLLFVFAFTAAFGQNRSLSLKQAVQLGLENNVDILNAGLEKQKSQSQFEEQQSKRYPQLEAYSNFNYYYSIPKTVLPGEIFGQTGQISVEIGTTYDWSSGFSASQILYNQSYSTSLRLAREQIHMEDLNLQQKQEELVYQVSQVYALCQATKQQTDHLGVTLENMERVLQLTELQQKNGMIRKVDHDQVLVDQNNLQTQIDNLSRLYNEQIRLLKYLIGMDEATPIDLSDSFDFSDEQLALFSADWDNRTEMQTIDQQIRIADLSRKMNRQKYLPVLSGTAEYFYQGQRDKFDFFKGGNDKFFKVGYVGLRLSIPIFDGFEKRSKIRQDQLSLIQLQNTRKNTLNYFNKELSDAQKQYDNNRLVVIRQQQNIQMAEENYRVYLLGYQQQTVSLADLLNAQNSLTEARLSCDNALLQLKNAVLDLKKSRGELLEGFE